MNKSYKDYIGALLMGIGGFALIAFGWPYLSRTLSLNSTISDRTTIYQSMQTALANVNNLKKEYQQKSEDIRKIDSVLPGTKDSAGLISVLDDVSSKTGLQMTRLTLGDVKSQANEPLGRVSWDMNTRGDYGSLVIFLKSLEKNLRLLDISSIQISRDQDKLGFRLEGYAYYINQ